MANEISGSASLIYASGADRSNIGFTILDDIGATGRIVFQDYSIGAVEEQIDVEDITAIDYVAFKNLGTDPALYIDVGPATAVYGHRLYGHATADRGDGVIGKWNESAAIFAVSSSGTQILRVLLINVT